MAKRLTEALWAKVRVDREKKGLSFHELADKYGVSSATIHRRAKSNHWSEPVCTEQTKRNETEEVERNETSGKQVKSFDEKVKALRAKVKPDCLSEPDSKPKQNETQNETSTPVERIDLKRHPETVIQNFDPSRAKDKTYMHYQLEAINEHLGDLSSVFDSDNRGKYRPEFAKIAYNIALLGGTPERLAATLSVSEQTIYNWLNTHPEFQIAWVGGKDFADAEVAKALFKKALGYQITVEDFKVYKGDLVPYDKTVIVEPDVNAQKFWLINRQPNDWKEKVEVREEINVAVIDSAAAEERYKNILNEALALKTAYSGRAERLGLTLDGDSELDAD